MEPFDKEYYQNNNQDKDRPALLFYERVLSRYIKSGRILDFGCGNGHLIRRLKKKYDVIGYEISNYAKANAEAINIGTRIYDTLESLNTIEEKSINGIISLHVLEHIGDSELENIFFIWKKKLKDDGIVLVAMPNLTGKAQKIKGNDWIGYKDKSHINLKGSDDWTKFFLDNGFKAIKIGTDGLWDNPYSKNLPKIIDQFIYSFPTLIQFIAGRLILGHNSGESIIFVLNKYVG